MWRWLRRSDDDFSEEIRADIALETDRLIGEGLNEKEAREAALRSFGNVTRAQERFHTSHRVMWLDDLQRDIKYACRTLLKNPGFTGVAILTLALGIGANTAIFSVVYAVLLRPLPYSDSDRLVRIIENLTPDSAGTTRRQPVPFDLDELATFRSHVHTLSHVGVYPRIAMWLRGRDASMQLVGNRLSAAILPMLGAEALRGRIFDPADESASAEPTLLLSYRAWHRYFGGRREILGDAVLLDGVAHRVIGIMPPAFDFPDPQAEFWVAARPAPMPPGAFQKFPVIARVREGVTIAEATQEVTRILDDMRGNPPAEMFETQPAPYEIIRLQDELVGPIKWALVVLIGAVALVLLIACTNVANLLLARSGARQREIVVRGALGASASRLMRQLLTESLVLAIIGGIAGVGLAMSGVRLFRVVSTNLERRDLGPVVSLPRLHEVDINLEVLAYALAASVLTGLLFGVVPAFLQTRGLSREVVRQGAGLSHSGFNRQRSAAVLVVGEIALTSTLLVGAGLLLRSYAKLSSVDPGYDLNVLTFQVARGPYAPIEHSAFAEQLLPRLRALPGVQSAGWAPLLPMVTGPFGTSFRPITDPPENYPVRSYPVSLDFLRTMGVRVVSGRSFNETDREGSIMLALINETLARMAFPGQDPVGRFANNGFIEIIGVVEDIRQFGLDQAPGPQIFLDARHRPGLPRGLSYGPYFALRIDGDPRLVLTGLRAVVKQIDPRGTVENVATMAQIVANSIARPRMYAVLLNVFAAIAIALAAIGIYGVISFTVVRRTKELGIRVALGAERGQILRLVLRQGLGLTLAGLLAGLAGALGMTRYLESLLFGVTPLDWPSFVAAALLIGSVAVLASYLPARRATRLDPIVALRCE
jgi:putative ABC transport system permease protein